MGGGEHSSQVHLYTRAAITSMIFCPDVHIMGLFWLPSCKYVGTVLLSLFSSPPKHSETEKLKTSEIEVKNKTNKKTEEAFNGNHWVASPCGGPGINLAV